MCIRDRTCTLGEEDPVPDSLTDDILWLVCNRRFDDFRALVTAAPARVDRFPLLPYAAHAVAFRGCANFDGLPGPTHSYSGLARGNLAAERNAQQVANPRASPE